ncbi:hypothetical protein DL764_006168 [Monosporascus ibericus]|uniref:BZIP domain-containing protein n=1 Tax=Monosporascus ibericus TaxID=155417 RepID=A0A4Q4T9H7_9PEZI|nr:hypothetical protein DL764_006168 [Monosporascus ibericus]
MPRKIRIPEDPARNRENQQRCRARRREYVQELERRVREYERRDSEATYEMQRAAQAVVWKNERLLALLALHGVSRAEIDAFLQQPDGVGAAAAANNATPSAAGFTPVTAISAGGVGAPSGGGAKLDGLGISSNAKAGSPGHEPLARACCATRKSDESCSAGTDSQSSYEAPETDILSRQPDPTSSDTPADNVHLPATGIGASNGSQAQVTSCDAAATIIADLQGHGDASQARRLLDCGDSSNCHVKNTRLFQLMVETP